ncbi:MAG TPA: hypothetical protein PLY96_11865, partial [Chromatiaceae bacterium]|nr:hypothetical protein [Chromatiaceae bacterium]
MRRYQPYPAYKDSGVEWLGEVPEQWAPKRLKYVANIVMGQSPPSDECNLDGEGQPFLQGCAEFTDYSPLARQYCKIAAKHAETGDILFSVRAPVGAMNVA